MKKLSTKVKLLLAVIAIVAVIGINIDPPVGQPNSIDPPVGSTSYNYTKDINTL